MYTIYRKYLDRQAWANSVDPDEMPQNVASHQSLHCNTYSSILDTLTGSRMNYFKFLDKSLWKHAYSNI